MYSLLLLLLWLSVLVVPTMAALSDEPRRAMTRMFVSLLLFDGVFAAFSFFVFPAMK